MSIRTDIADAVVSELGGADLGAVTIGRAYVPLYDLDSAVQTYLTVVSRSFTTEPATRNSNATEVEIDIAIQRKVTSESAAEIDPLAALVEQVIDVFRGARRLSAYPQAALVRVENPATYVPELLRDKRLFLSVITLGFRVVS